jgi:hypothetical protein
MNNKKVGSLTVTVETLYKGEMPSGFKSDGSKEITYKHIYFKNLKKRTCTCVIKSTLTDRVIGVGVSKCHPKENFDLGIGITIAEYRAKIELYKRNIIIIGEKI